MPLRRRAGRLSLQFGLVGPHHQEFVSLHQQEQPPDVPKTLSLERASMPDVRYLFSLHISFSCIPQKQLPAGVRFLASSRANSPDPVSARRQQEEAERKLRELEKREAAVLRREREAAAVQRQQEADFVRREEVLNRKLDKRTLNQNSNQSISIFPTSGSSLTRSRRDLPHS